MDIRGLNAVPGLPKRAPTGGPREPQDGPQSAQERSSKSAPPRGVQEAIYGALEGGGANWSSPLV
eukprot:6231561-Pyramimonas_sp.AAC.2